MQSHASEETGRAALLACAPYYFSKAQLESGINLLRSVPFNCHAANWWFQKITELHFTAQWIPQEIETLIVGGAHDSVTPFSLFKNDARFQRENIRLHLLEQSGHFSWLDQPQEIKALFQELISRLLME